MCCVLNLLCIWYNTENILDYYLLFFPLHFTCCCQRERDELLKVNRFYGDRLEKCIAEVSEISCEHLHVIYTRMPCLFIICFSVWKGQSLFPCWGKKIGLLRDPRAQPPLYSNSSLDVLASHFSLNIFFALFYTSFLYASLLYLSLSQLESEALVTDRLPNEEILYRNIAALKEVGMGRLVSSYSHLI